MSIISKILEERKMKGKDPCWKGYQMVGMKDKDGRKVPNCVPEEVELEEAQQITHSKVEKLMGDTQSRNQAIEKVKKAFNCSHEDACKHVDAVISKSMKEEKETDEQDTADYKIGKDGRKVRAHKVVFNKGEEEMKEELKGNQHKLDVNKNGKVDGEDLAHLRKKKSYKDFKEACGSMASKKKIKEDSDEEFSEDILEELAQIDELSKSTLASYVGKASRSAAYHRGAAFGSSLRAKNSNDPAEKEKEDKRFGDDYKKSVKRLQGVEKAANRLAKEEAEQIDELSKSTLASYVKKATKSFGAKRSIATSFEKDADAALSTSKRETDTQIANDYIKDARKRLININKAADRLAKEEVELDEEIKPYVSVDDKGAWSVLDHKGKEVKRFHWTDYKDHPIKDKRKAAKDDAMAYFKKHYNSLRKPTNECIEEVLLDLCEGMIERDDFDDRVAAYKKAGYKVLDHKHGESKAHISFVDSEGTHRTVKYTPTGKTMQNHGAYEGGKKDTEGNKVNKTEVKTVKRGRGRPRKDKFAESVDILLSLTEEEFEEILADSTLDEIVESLCNLSDEELKELKG